MENVWVLIADSYRARIFSVASPQKLLEIKDMIHPAAHLKDSSLGTDSPGRAQDSHGPHRHAMEEPTPLHETESRKFIHEVGTYLNQRINDFDKLHLVAPPKMLGYLRTHLPKSVQAKIAHEMAKDIITESTDSLPQRLEDFLKFGKHAAA